MDVHKNLEIKNAVYKNYTSVEIVVNEVQEPRMMILF